MQNGSGKSLILKAIQGILEPNSGHISTAKGVIFGYVPQIIEGIDNLSGSQCFNKILSIELSKAPNVLCLDEPTNHLDFNNRKSLLRMLKDYHHTLIIASHDENLSQNCTNIIWHIHHDVIEIFKGNYANYMAYNKGVINKQHKQFELLKKEQKQVKGALQSEQKRAAKSRKANRYEPDRKLKGAMKEKGSRTNGRKYKLINKVKSQIDSLLQGFQLPEVLKPKFYFSYTEYSKNKVIISVSEGSCGYNKPLLNNVFLQITATERVAVLGDNATGKSTLMKALLGKAEIKTTGY